MILTPTSLPPPNSHAIGMPTQISTPTQPHVVSKASVAQSSGATAQEERRRIELKIPTVVLDSQSVAHSMAAALATSLLGHVLFLKSQVPFPVAQLSRMAVGQTDSRAAKRCHDLLSAFDTLSSHFRTTFIALSTALALGKEYKEMHSQNSNPLACAHLAFVLGPSVGAARARVMLVIDGLEVKFWGMRGDNENVALDDELSEDSEEDLPDSDEESESEEEYSESEEESDGSNEEDSKSADGSASSEPSNLRSASSSPLSSSPPSTPQLTDDSPKIEERRKPLSVSSTSPSSHILRSPPLGLTPSHAEEQQALRAAERLLSRTLANACAEDSGGISCELSATQTHVLLRAPRRFAHPAWIPKQNLTRSLEGTLATFLDESCVPADQVADTSNGKRKPLRGGVKTEGVWIGCRESNGLREHQTLISSISGVDVDEDDEMIWWAWDGKLVGFSDW